MSSAPAKPFVAQHSVPVGVTSTRWWWVRHAPVREDGGNIYGQYDIGCDCSDTVVFQGVAKFLPQNALWFSSNLKRTHQTAAAIWAAGLPRPDRMHQELKEPVRLSRVPERFQRERQRLHRRS